MQTDDFDAGVEARLLIKDTAEAGAIAQFIGVMRDNNEGDAVSAMTLEHYPGMTEKSIDNILNSAEKRWPIIGASVIHRVGTLRPGEQIVFVAVSARHRKAAFQACEFIMDILKSQAPFWKKELLNSGETRWVDTRDSDAAALARWL